MNRPEIVELLETTRDGVGVLPAEAIRKWLTEAIHAVNSLPDTAPDLAGKPWLPARSMVAVVPGDCLISLKAAIDAGARIVIEPANPEAD